MLGHRLLIDLARRHQVTGAIRGPAQRWRDHPILRGHRLISGWDAAAPDSILPLLDRERPGVAINCVGIIKQVKEASDPVASIAINALWPHRLAAACRERRIRLVHFSTDCVFSGERGPYAEDDVADARDLYGRTKLLGETAQPGCLTLRSSIIGHELRGGSGLLEWFIGRHGATASGFSGALYSGLTTNEMAAIIGRIVEEFLDLDGLWHVASTPIDKFTLLAKLNAAYGLGIALDRDESFRCDRRLDGGRFAAATGIVPAGWDDMIAATRDAHLASSPAGVASLMAAPA
ncbi:MAG: sugar nucleotide-binding protein, partial [Stellaceae bacterium]